MNEQEARQARELAEEYRVEHSLDNWDDLHPEDPPCPDPPPWWSAAGHMIAELEAGE